MKVATRGRLLEREAELQTLADRLLGLARDGRGGVLLIEGPPGIGKSALLDRALDAAPEGVVVRRAAGSELESGLAFGAVRQLLAGALRGLDADVFEGPGRPAARVLGFAEGGSDALVDPLFSLQWVVEALAERAPLVLAIDDLHWLDEESGRFVGYLVRRLEGVPVLVLATARPAEPGATNPVTLHAEVLRPQPLSAGALGAVVAGRDPQAVLRATGGNPLLATQLAQAPAALALDEIALTGVGEMVLDRVRRLSEDAVALARGVSVFPDGAELEDAAAVAGLAAAPAAAAADGLVAAHVLGNEDRLRFLHPVMRTAVYGQLGPFERRAGHAAAARLLRERGAPVEAIAGQLLRAAAEGDAENVKVLRRAAETAVAAAAPRAAVRYLERAVDEPVPAGRERFEVLFVLGRLRARLGREGAVAALRQAADAAPDPWTRAEASLHAAGVLLARYEVVDADRVLAGLLESELSPEQRLMAHGLRCACFSERQSSERFRAAVAALPPDVPGDTPAQRIALFWRWSHDVGRFATRDEALAALLRCIDDEASVPFAEYGLMTLDPVPHLSALGAFDELERIAEQRMDIARERGDEALYVGGLLARGGSLKLRGRWKLAEADLQLTLAQPNLTGDQRITALEVLVEVLARQGRSGEARAAVAELEGLGAAALRVDLGRALIAHASGDPSPDGEGFKRMAEALTALGWTFPSQNRWLCSYSDHLIWNGRTDEARTLMEEYLAAADPAGDPAAIGDALTVLGRCSRGPEAVALLERAVAVLDPSPHEWLRGWAHLELGAALRRDGRRADSREHLRAALAYASEHGEARLERRAREELELAGGSTREAVARDRDALTPAEGRVARLAADGLSNKEIAAQLFLTVGSVQTTLIRVFRKLGINSRRDLPGLL